MAIWRPLPTRPPWQPQPLRGQVPAVAPPAGILTPDPVAVVLAPVAPTVSLPITLTPSPVAVPIALVVAQVGGRKALLMADGTEGAYVTWTHGTTQPVTMAFWCKLNGQSSGHGNVATLTNPSFNSEVGFWIPDWRERIYQASVMIVTVQTDALSPTVNYGEWHHVVFSRDDPSGNFRGYLDGVPFPDETGTTPDPNGTISDVAYVAVGTGGVTHYVRGAISQFRVWLARLSAAEIWSEMLSQTAVRTSNLYGDWSFDNTLNDQSSNGRHMAGITIPVSGAITYTDGPPAVTSLTPSPTVVDLEPVALTVSVGGATTTLTPSPAVVDLEPVAVTLAHAKTLTPGPQAVDLEPVAISQTHAKALTSAPVAVDLEPVAVILAHALALAPGPQAVDLEPVAVTISAGAAPTTLTPSPVAVDLEPVAIAQTHAKSLQAAPQAIPLLAVALGVAHAKTLAAGPVAVPLSPVGFLLDLGGVLTLAPIPVAVPLLPVGFTVIQGTVLQPSPVAVPLLPVAVARGGTKTLALSPQAVALGAVVQSYPRVRLLEPTPQVVQVLAVGPSISQATALALLPQAIALLPVPVSISGIVVLGPGILRAGTDLVGATRAGAAHVGRVRAGARSATLRAGPSQKP